MAIKRIIKNVISSAGWSVKLTKNLPIGIDWALDLKRMVLGCQPSIIFDVGANIGQTTLWLRSNFPSAIIHAFEPIPETYKSLIEATKQFQNVECYPFALGAEPGTMKISTIPNETRNSLVTGIFEDHPEAQQVEIEIQTVDTLCKEHGIDRIDILKTDTEGFDDTVMKGASGMLGNERVSVVVSEITFDSQNSLQTSFHDLFARLNTHGFLPCGFYETETLYNTTGAGSYCNALFIRRDLIRSEP